MYGPPVQVVIPGSAVSPQVATRCLALVGSTAMRVSNWSSKFMLPGGLKPVSQPAKTSGSFETWMSGPSLKSLACVCAANCTTVARHRSVRLAQAAPCVGLGQTLGQFIEFVVHNFLFSLVLVCIEESNPFLASSAHGPA